MTIPLSIQEQLRNAHFQTLVNTYDAMIENRQRIRNVLMHPELLAEMGFDGMTKATTNPVNKDKLCMDMLVAIRELRKERSTAPTIDSLVLLQEHDQMEKEFKKLKLKKMPDSERAHEQIQQLTAMEEKRNDIIDAAAAELRAFLEPTQPLVPEGP